MAKKITKAAKAEKAERVTAASIVLGLLRMKQVPSDEAIISAVHEGVEETKFDKTQLAWYKYQYRVGRWNEGERQTINQASAPKTAKAIKAAKKPAKKSTKKAAPVEETEEVEA